MNDMIQIYAVRLNQILEKDKFDRLLTYVSNEKFNRIRRFYRVEDAQRTLIGDILIRCLLCRELKIRNNALVFADNEYGKPFLKNYGGIHFNISHSGEWVACCVHTLPVGIDVEVIKPIDISIAERFFSKEEYGALVIKNIIERQEHFYSLWTLKESYIKAVGKGLSIPLDSFTIRIDNDNINVCVSNELENYYFRHYYIDDSYKMAVCARREEFPQDIEIVDVNRLYEEALLL